MKTTKSAIALVIEPLRASAVLKAEGHAKVIIENMRADMAAGDMDMQKVAPYPDNCWSPDYKQKKQRRNFLLSLTAHRETQLCSSPRDPEYRDFSEEIEARFIKAAKENASIEFDAFIAKLEGKVGAHSTATLAGSFVWSHSVLTVTTPEGVQRWKTQQIVNVSVHGKLFNQYPTRKIK